MGELISIQESYDFDIGPFSIFSAPLNLFDLPVMPTGSPFENDSGEIFVEFCHQEFKTNLNFAFL